MITMLTLYVLCQKTVTCSVLITVKTVDGFHSWLIQIHTRAFNCCFETLS